MKNHPLHKKLIRNQTGSLALDFIFAFTLIFGFTLIMFAFALTLTAAEMTQYLTYTSARAYFASHFNLEEQRQMAGKKYDSLMQQQGYSFLSNSSWFLVGSRFIGNMENNPSPEFAGYKVKGDEPNRFHGVSVSFIAKILSMSSPFFGTTDPDGDGTGSTFTTHIGSYLGREPTMEECFNFNKERWKFIRKLSVTGGGASYSTGTSSNADNLRLVADNGC
jgi:hypothetical protein